MRAVLLLLLLLLYSSATTSQQHEEEHDVLPPPQQEMLVEEAALNEINKQTNDAEHLINTRDQFNVGEEYSIDDTASGDERLAVKEDERQYYESRDAAAEVAQADANEGGAAVSSESGSSTVEGGGDSNATDSDAQQDDTASSPDQKKKKVPLREILLRLKPASLMDDEEREAAIAERMAAQREKLKQASNLVAGSAASVESVLQGNRVEDNSKANKSSVASRKAVCAPDETADTVQLLNATGLQELVSPNPNISTRSVAAPCVLMFFFSTECQFSVAAAPHILAMARGLQGVMPVYGVDSVEQHSTNAQYGVMGTPTLLLFHNGYSVAQYNASSYTGALLSSFLQHFTDYTFNDNFNASDADLQESVLPLEVVPGNTCWLIASWLFLVCVTCYCFLRSAFFDRIMEAVLNNWREAEAHQHQD